MSIKYNYTFWIIIICFSIFFVNLDAIMVNIMEARNFITAREIVNSGNWILTTLNGEPRYEKPPLPTWLTAISALILGFDNLVALRIPAALISTLLVVYFYKLGEVFTNNKKYSFVSSLILTTSFFIIFSGRNGQWDIFTHGFMIVSIYQLFLFFSFENKKYQRAIIAALFFGFSFMSKGPVSLYTLLLPFIISYGFTFKFKEIKQRIVPLTLFLIIGFVVSAWWYIYTYYTDPITVSEITSKETNNWTSYEIKPFYYYWGFFTQSGVWSIMALIGLLYPYLKNKVSNKRAYKFTFLWTIISLVLLSIIPEKKSRYVLPVLIPLAFNTGFYLEYLITQFSSLKNKKETLPVYFNFGLIGVIGILFPVGGYFYLKDMFSGNWIWFVLLSICTVLISILIFKFLLKKNILMVFYLTIAFVISIIFFGFPIVKELTVNPDFYGISNLNSWEIKTNNKTYEFNELTPELVWDYGKPMKILLKGNEVNFPSEDSFGVLIQDNQEQRFFEVFKDYSLKKIRRFDMNPREKGGSQYRSRLCRELYLVSKKQ